MREKDILSQVDHPNIIRLEDTFLDKENLYFCFEYYQFGDLAGLIRSKKKLSLDQTRFYAMEMINGLEYLRTLSIVHRDIKPENIMIDNSFHCKITDFGSAKIINEDKVEEEIKREYGRKSDVFEVDIDYETFFDTDDESFSEVKNMQYMKQGTFVGTPLYVSPEMLEHSISHFASDLWSLGCIIYQ